MTLAITTPDTTPAADLDVMAREVMNHSWCVVTFTTLNSHYTLLKRQRLVVLTKDTATGPAPVVREGDVVVGIDAKVLEDGCLYVYNHDGVVMHTSRITSAYVLEN